MGRGSQALQHPKTCIAVLWNRKHLSKVKDAGVYGMHGMSGRSRRAWQQHRRRRLMIVRSCDSTPTITIEHRTHDAKRAHNRATLSSCRACQISSATRRDPVPRAANTCLAQTFRCSQIPSSSAALGAKFSRFDCDCPTRHQD